jgi:hypothetical protein
VSLLSIAFWDWCSSFDKSRTMVSLLGLSLGLIVSSLVATSIDRNFGGSFFDQSTAMVSWMALSLALVQLYRSQETVRTIIRGWMYAITIITTVVTYQWSTRTMVALTGPFPSPAYLAGAMVLGVFLMPIGFALEEDRRLKWAYPVIAVMATWVVWTTHRSVAFAWCLIVLIIWLALYHRILVIFLVVIGTTTAIILHQRIPLRWADVGMEPPLNSSLHFALMDAAWRILQDSHFLGTGPGGLSAKWPTKFKDYQGPYSAFLEVASQYGMAFTVVLICSLIAVVLWCIIRLRNTHNQPLHSPFRAPALWVLLMILSLPWTSSIQAQWLNMPLSALAAATLAMLARHIESPRGRALIWPVSPSPGPNVVPVSPPDHC